DLALLPQECFRGDGFLVPGPARTRDLPAVVDGQVFETGRVGESGCRPVPVLPQEHSYQASCASVNVAETTIPPLGGLGSGFSTHARVQRPSGVSATEAAPPCRQRCLVQSPPTSPNGIGAPKPRDAPPAAPARLSCGRVKLSSDCVQSASIRPSGASAT